MKTKNNHGEDHRRVVGIALQRWLVDRQQLLGLLCRLGDRKRGNLRRSETRQLLDRFCEALVDYVSAGHFEIYDRLLEAGERLGSRHGREMARLYAVIVPTTVAALAFNDHYFNGGSGRDLMADLSELGQVLAERFDHEDALIRQTQARWRKVA